MSNHAYMQFLIRALSAPGNVFPSLCESIHVDAIVNKNDLIGIEDLLRAKSFSYRLRNADDASGPAQCEPVNPVKRKKDVPGQHQPRAGAPCGQSSQRIATCHMSVNNFDFLVADKPN